MTPTETNPIGTMERLRRYEEITALASETESADIMAYIGGDDQSEVAKLKASLAHTASALGREIALCQQSDERLRRCEEALRLARDYVEAATKHESYDEAGNQYAAQYARECSQADLAKIDAALTPMTKSEQGCT